MTASSPTAADLEALVAAAVEKRIGSSLNDLERTVAELRSQVAEVREHCPEDRATIVAFSGDMDRLFAAFTIASGAVAMGMEVSIFFTFWGLAALRVRTTYSGKSLGQKMAAVMLPSGPGSVPTSRMNMAGMGPAFFKMLMKQKNVQSLPEMLEMVRELGVRLVACEMSMGVMGVSREELLPDIDYGGVATYLGDAARSKITLFI
ncbi:MAG: coenzyme disulfide reductase [Planctomycetota bacterium]